MFKVALSMPLCLSKHHRHWAVFTLRAHARLLWGLWPTGKQQPSFFSSSKIAKKCPWSCQFCFKICFQLQIVGLYFWAVRSIVNLSFFENSPRISSINCQSFRYFYHSPLLSRNFERNFSLMWEIQCAVWRILTAVSQRFVPYAATSK